MTDRVRIGPLLPTHRSQVEAIVRATNVFSEDEVDVALEVFDEANGKWRIENGKWEDGEAHSPFSILQSSSGYEFVGAFEADRLIGYACFGATPATDNTFDLYWIAVHPDAQGSGAGSALMTEVEHRLAQRRARLLVVETSSRDDYAPTRRFYEKRGYNQSARIRDFYASGDDRLVLTKHLIAPGALTRSA